MTNQPTNALSPYLPGTRLQYAWDSTSLGYLKTCPRLYYYTQLEGWTSKEDSVFLRFGIEYHTALQEYALGRAKGWKHEQTLRAVILNTFQRTFGWNPEHKNRTKLNLIKLLVWYLDFYNKDKPDAAVTHILPDGKVAVEQSFRFELDFAPKTVINNISKQPYVLCGHIDRIVEYSGSLWAMDHKTSTFVPHYYLKNIEPHNQFSLYSFAAGVVLGQSVKGVLVDVAQVVTNDKPAFERAFTLRSNDQIKEWVGDLHFWFGLAEEYSKYNYYPQNDTACDKFGGCRFREVCSRSPQVRTEFLKADFVQLPEDQRWNPLKSR